MAANYLRGTTSGQAQRSLNTSIVALTRRKVKVHVTCHNCRTECRKFGRHRNGLPRYQCRQCRKTFTEPHADTLDGMYLSVEKAEMVLRLLLEGNSVSSVERATDVHHTMGKRDQPCFKVRDSIQYRRTIPSLRKMTL